MVTFEHTLLAIKTWGARGHLYAFEPPCPHLNTTKHFAPEPVKVERGAFYTPSEKDNSYWRSLPI